MIVYLAHPVGHDPEERIKNLENAQKWFLYFIEHCPSWSINVPWFIYVSNLDETHRSRAMRDDLTILDTCDAIVLTGGRISDGMNTELTKAMLSGLDVLDLTSFGYSPSDDKDLKSAVEGF